MLGWKRFRKQSAPNGYGQKSRSVAVLLISSIALAAYSPDLLSALIVGLICIIALAGCIHGLLPTISITSGLLNGQKSIRKASETEGSSAWVAALQIERFFQQKTLDGLFEEYREKVQHQRETGQIVSDLDEVLNEDVLALHTWKGVIAQLPGTLTGLGILGTFVGLLLGLRGISFVTVEAALGSVQSILAGINTAFYTSIAGVILSILFNITNNVLRTIMNRETGLFLEEFHKSVIPTTDERVLMPQILDGLRKNEFTFFLQPRYDLNTRRVVGAEALVRWNHPVLGVISPAVFIPVLENNGYITKLDPAGKHRPCDPAGPVHLGGSMQDHPRMDRCGSPPGPHRGQCYKDGYSGHRCGGVFLRNAQKVPYPAKISEHRYCKVCLSGDPWCAERYGSTAAADGLPGDIGRL